MREMYQTFGITALGETVESWTLKNELLTAEVLTYGATLRRLVFGGVDVVLGYDTLPEYEGGDGCFGATVGRVCNRIGGASFTLNGKTYPLAKNDGENHLHGGVRGFDKRIWRPRRAACPQDGRCRGPERPLTSAPPRQWAWTSTPRRSSCGW